MKSLNPYANLPESAFWRPAIADRHFNEFDELSGQLDLHQIDKIATAGSCFAQHIGRALKARGAAFLDLEPPPAYLFAEDAKNHGFNIYSCRYGNIYTARQLRQLIQEAFGDFTPGETVWTKNNRYYDAMRPSVDPVGHETADIVIALRNRHLEKIRQLLQQVDVFVFTLGLTEAWKLKSDGTVFPTCPGTIAGIFDDEKYSFQNFQYPEIKEDLTVFREYLKSQNKNARILLTVSPVPLTATASGQHVLPATIYSKSTLRAVAGDMSAAFDDVFYFPSYELIASHPTRATFFNRDMRTVNEFGVEFVMRHFFRSVNFSDTAAVVNEDNETNSGAIICDEEKLEAHYTSK